LSNRLLNTLQYHKMRSRERTGLTSFEPYFYPLDAVQDWNRLYGPQGFLQYQYVLPDERDAARGVRKTLELLTRRGVGSFVAGLKRMQGDRNALPFGLDGLTFGIDFGFGRHGLESLLQELDGIVMEHGGRVCLSKDSRLSPETFRAMYPEYPRWIEIVRRYAPIGRFRSRMADRLQL
jgi:hypothetical protein